MKPHTLVFALFLAPALASAATSVNFTSPNSVIESCTKLSHFPGNYSKKDLKEEDELCSIDMYRADVAVCPKTWSTSAGTIFYSLEGLKQTQAQFEAAQCANQKAEGLNKLSKFKTTMNQSGTSGTFAPSSLLYYHFSRYLQTIVRVPVSVMRTIDKDEHLERVASKAKGQGAMNKTAWEIMRAAEKNPAAYKPTRELITADGKQIFGVLLGKDPGERYGTEVNGVRSAWGDAQNKDFQATPGYIALRSEKDFDGAVKDGIASVKASAKISKDIGGLSLNSVQVGLWMRELTEITLLDFIFNQQDRVGNIDYAWYWVYSDGTKVKATKEDRKEFKKLPRAKMKAIAPPAELAAFKPVLVQKSSIGDNDAGGRLQYANYTRRTQMLEKIRHYDAGTYRRLLALNADLQGDGPISKALNAEFTLDKSQIAMIVKNTADATKILKDSCAAGRLHFDLDFDKIATGSVAEERVDCSKF